MPRVIGQTPIISLMNQLGYRVSEEGVCHGISYSFLEKILLGKMKEYCARRYWLAEQFEQVPDLIEKHRIPLGRIRDSFFSINLNEYNDEGKKIIDILYYLKAIKLLQDTSNTSTDITLCHDHLHTISKLVYSEEFEQTGGLVSLYEGTILHYPMQWCEYLERIRLIIKAENMANWGIGIIIKIPIMKVGHALSLGYDHENDAWVLEEPNLTPGFLDDLSPGEWNDFCGGVEIKPSKAYVKNGRFLKILKDHYFSDVEPDLFCLNANVKVYIAANHPNRLRIQSRFMSFETVIHSNLLEMAALTSSSGNKLSHQAARGGDVTTLRKLYELGVDCQSKDINGSTPFRLAAHSSKALSFFIDEGFDIRLIGEESIIFTVALYCPHLLDAFLKAKIHLQPLKMPLLHFCAGENIVLALEIITKAKYKININQKDAQGFTALNIASMEGHFEVVKLLLNAGSDPLIASNKKFFPIEFALMHNHYKVALWLLGWSYPSLNQLNLFSHQRIQNNISNLLKEFTKLSPMEREVLPNASAIQKYLSSQRFYSVAKNVVGQAAVLGLTFFAVSWIKGQKDQGFEHQMTYR